MRFMQIGCLGLCCCAVLGLVGSLPEKVIAESCVAKTSCTAQPIQFTPGSWVNFEFVNLTANIINVEQPNSVEPITLSPGQTTILGGTTTRNISLLFWDIQGLSLQARLKKIEPNTLRVELHSGNGFGNYSLYLKDDGRIELP